MFLCVKWITYLYVYVFVILWTVIFMFCQDVLLLFDIDTNDWITHLKWDQVHRSLYGLSFTKLYEILQSLNYREFFAAADTSCAFFAARFQSRVERAHWKCRWKVQWHMSANVHPRTLVRLPFVWWRFSFLEIRFIAERESSMPFDK